MTCKWGKIMRLALIFCGMSLMALACTGCLAAAKYQDLTWNLNSAEDEFSKEAREGKDVIWKGEYLGLKKDSRDNNRSVHHYQFQGLLDGNERTLHFILSTNSKYDAYAVEGERIEATGAQPAWLVLANNHSKEELEGIAKGIQAQSPLVAPPCILYINLSLGGCDDFCATADPELASKLGYDRSGEIWCGLFKVSWKKRSRIRHSLRYAHANAVAFMYVPVDVALAVTSPVWVPLLALSLSNMKW